MGIVTGGHLRWVDLDPLKCGNVWRHQRLDYKFYGFSDNDLDEVFDIGVMFITRNKFRYVI